MSRDKQIEEMAKIINKPCFEIMEEAGATDRDCPFPYGCEECTAVNLYNAGYRKASDVAREIIGKILLNHMPNIGGFFIIPITELAELKKKYESEGEG